AERPLFVRPDPMWLQRELPPMELAEALQIVGALGDGHDPLTGQQLPPDHVCQQPQVVRALCLVVHQLQSPELLGDPARDGLPNAGKKWTEEETELVRAFDAGANLSELARKHGRTRPAIHGRLYRLGKMPPWPLTRQCGAESDGG